MSHIKHFLIVLLFSLAALFGFNTTVSAGDTGNADLDGQTLAANSDDDDDDGEDDWDDENDDDWESSDDDDDDDEEWE